MYLEGRLKQHATEAGHSFKEFFEAKREVSCHGRKEREFKGNEPEVDPAVFNALPKGRSEGPGQTGHRQAQAELGPGRQRRGVDRAAVARERASSAIGVRVTKPF
jgi:hypothetical protein